MGQHVCLSQRGIHACRARPPAVRRFLCLASFYFAFYLSFIQVDKNLLSFYDMTNHMDHRRYLDFLFFADAIVSLAFGVIAILTPHGTIRSLGGGEYNHSAHEVFR